MRYDAFRKPVAPPRRSRATVKNFPAPVRGWVTNENLSAQGPASALVLDNWFPTSSGIRVRGGARKTATVADGGPVVSMWRYVNSAGEQLFAATEDKVFDLTSVADADTIPTADISSQTSGYYSTTQFSTAGGNYLYAVNGDDDAQLYDGSSWATINSGSWPISITGVSTSAFSHVWSFAKRLFFVEKGTLNAWYLPVDSLGGAASSFSLAGMFQNGGELLFGATWSLDSGDGLDDKCVFVSSLGEVAVYEGTDPSSSTTWTKVGVYQITEPLGLRAHIRAGGDLLVATEAGIVPLSEAIRKDVAALSLSAITRAIEPDWKDEVVARRAARWEILKWPSNNMMIVSLPITQDGQEARCLVANMETGAWCRFTGWDTNCMTLYDDFGYFGTSEGEVYQMEVGGNDGGENYTCAYAGAFDHMGVPGQQKTVQQARVSYRAQVDLNARISVSSDYAIAFPSPPSSIANFSNDEWDSGKWDEATWDTQTNLSVTTRWQSIGRTGFAFAPQVQATFGITPRPRVELIAMDVTSESGEFVV